MRTGAGVAHPGEPFSPRRTGSIPSLTTSVPHRPLAVKTEPANK